MILQNNSLKEIYDAILPHVENLINQTPEEIVNRYSNLEINILTFTKSHSLNERLEIRFEEEQATLTCEFDGKNLCDTVNIFTDINPTVEECTEMFNRNYIYNRFFKRWKTPSCYLYINKLDDMIYYKFTKREPLFYIQCKSLNNRLWRL